MIRRPFVVLGGFAVIGSAFLFQNCGPGIQNIAGLDSVSIQSSADPTPFSDPLNNSLPSINPDPNPTPTVVPSLKNLWAVTTDSSAPSARYGHNAVWTGSKMIVWGGYFKSSTSVDFVSDGKIFNSMNNSWTPMSTTGMPSQRGLTSASWVNGKMILFGGCKGTVHYSDVHSYDPATDTWQSLAFTGAAPVARCAHTSVWTGSRLIVWGGYTTGGKPLNSGISIDLSTMTWSEISSADAPAARLLHSAVWTGSQMIVFGGGLALDSRSGDLNDGGIYDPSTNSWSALPTAGALDVRRAHVAVWTGNKMIVYGGYKNVSTGSLSGGGIFDPVTGSWTTLDHSLAVSYASAVWTGQKMLIFGGATGFRHTVTPGANLVSFE